MYCLKLKGILVIINKFIFNDLKKNVLVVFFYKYFIKNIVF